MLLVKPPKNVSKEHYELSQISKYLARHKGCYIIAEEVSGFADKKLFRNKKGVVDVAGIKLVDKKTNELPEIITYAFEAKASLADFRQGYNAGGLFNYIIAPKGIIPVDEIPDGIGFYEVDLKNYRIGTNRVYYGIKLVKKPKRRNTKRRYRTRFLQMKYTAVRATNCDIFNNPKIVLADHERKV